LLKNKTIQEEFEDTKGVIIIRISNKNRQHNGQKKKYKKTNNDLQNKHIKLKIANSSCIVLFFNKFYSQLYRNGIEKICAYASSLIFTCTRHTFSNTYLSMQNDIQYCCIAIVCPSKHSEKKWWQLTIWP
jgi:hypothetical protein